eukprot:1603376-Prymnesium_polylepis.1
MAAEEAAQATRRWQWWSGAAASETRLDAKKDLTTKMRESCRERFAYFPFWSAAAASHCVHSCSRSMFEKSHDESSYRGSLGIQTSFFSARIFAGIFGF